MEWLVSYEFWRNFTKRLNLMESFLCVTVSSNSCVFCLLHPNIQFPVFSQSIGFKMSGHYIPSLFYSYISRTLHSDEALNQYTMHEKVSIILSWTKWLVKTAYISCHKFCRNSDFFLRYFLCRSAYILKQDSLPSSYKSFLNKHGGKDLTILQGVKDVVNHTAFSNLAGIEKYYKSVGVDIKLDPNMKVPCSVSLKIHMNDIELLSIVLWSLTYQASRK